MSLVFSLVALLIASMFGASIVTETLNAAESSALLRESEKASASAVCAARLIQKSLKAAPDMAFANGRWTSGAGNEIVQNILTAALNADSPIALVWRVKSDRPEAENAFTDLNLTVTAHNCASDNLEKGDRPTIAIRFVCPNYKMTVRVTARAVEEITDADGALTGYLATFAKDGELDVQSSLGA